MNSVCQDPSAGYCKLLPPSLSQSTLSGQAPQISHNPCETRPKYDSWELTHNIGELDVYPGLSFLQWGIHRPREALLVQCYASLEEGQWDKHVAIPLILQMESISVSVVQGVASASPLSYDFHSGVLSINNFVSCSSCEEKQHWEWPYSAVLMTSLSQFSNMFLMPFWRHYTLSLPRG